MKLDRTTYEAWLLDRIEGRLTPDQGTNWPLSCWPIPTWTPVIRTNCPGWMPVPDQRSTRFLKQDLPPTGAPDLRNLDLFLVARDGGRPFRTAGSRTDRFPDGTAGAGPGGPADGGRPCARRSLPYPSEVDLRRTIPPWACRTAIASRIS